MENSTQPISNLTCPAYFDKYLQWSQTGAGLTASQPCPDIAESIFNGVATRYCHPTGRWTNRDNAPVENVTESFTNYNDCGVPIPSDVESDDMAWNQLTGTVWGIVGLIGLCFTITALVTSLCILQSIRIQNCRLKIHKQLFLAFLIEAVAQVGVTSENVNAFFQTRNGQNDTEVLSSGNATLGSSVAIWTVNCMFVMEEFGHSSVIAWAFVEGIHIFNIIVVSVFSKKFPLKLCGTIAWMSSIGITAIWLSAWLPYPRQPNWYYYGKHWSYHILTAFRLSLLLINIIFLTKVMYVFVNRLRANCTSELLKLRKATKAIALLMPLLGITNFVAIYQEPVSKVGFNIANGIRRIVLSWQGFIVSILYCFLNSTIRRGLRRSLVAFKRTHLTQHKSIFLTVTPINAPIR
ncbi:hypothetical protein CRM22_004600 [Opisthorchis felineus]|uniref:G-protein coupled receptors family 2 profile 2 domain-containing protein n=1 Tax=Opisthorchis felineus TaxID=147828 RepID=A0A4S2LVB4_OPIFE|nr:hypothetical protein CRM22_004600 [Opisthorchis felineus]